MYSCDQEIKKLKNLKYIQKSPFDHPPHLYNYNYVITLQNHLFLYILMKSLLLISFKMGVPHKNLMSQLSLDIGRELVIE